MKNVYAVINPSTKFVIGYVQVPESVKVEVGNPVPAFAVDTVSKGKKDILDVILVDNSHPDFKYDEEKYSLLDVRHEATYGVVLEGNEYRILTDNSVLRKLKDKIQSLEVTQEIKHLLSELSKLKDTFILKTFKEKPVEKVKNGDVILISGLLFQVSSVDSENIVVKEIKSVSEFGEEKTIKVDNVFRVGRF